MVLVVTLCFERGRANIRRLRFAADIGRRRRGEGRKEFDFRVLFKGSCPRAYDAGEFLGKSLTAIARPKFDHERSEL